LLLDQSLCWIAMQVEVTKIAEDLRDALSSVLDTRFVQRRNNAS